MTLDDVARRCEPRTTPQTIGRLETGTRTVSVGWLNRIAKALGVDAEDLVATIDLPHGRGLHVRAKVKWRRTEPAGVGVEFAEFLGESVS